MKKLELKQKSNQELKNYLVELKKDLMKLNAQRATGTVPENPGNIKKFRRTIARILTKLNQSKEEVSKKK